MGLRRVSHLFAVRVGVDPQLSVSVAQQVATKVRLQVVADVPQAVPKNYEMTTTTNMIDDDDGCGDGRQRTTAYGGDDVGRRR